MEYFVIILLIGLAIGYFVYQNMPSTKFKKANDLLQNGDIAAALQAFEALKEAHDDAGAQIAAIKLQLAKQTANQSQNTEKILAAFNEVLQVRPAIQRESINTANFTGSEQAANREIAKIHYVEVQNLLKNGKNAAAVPALEKTVAASNNIADLATIETHCRETLAKIFYANGTTAEAKKQYAESLACYEKAVAHLQWFAPETIARSPELKQAYSRTICRFCLVEIKQGKTPNDVFLTEIIEKNIAQTEYRDEVCFRYAHALAKQGNITKASKYIAFVRKHNAESQKLKTYCQESYTQQAVKEIEQLNNAVFGNDSDATISVYNRLNTILRVVEKGLPHLTKDVEKTKNYLFSKIINLYFENKQFENLIAHIATFDNFYAYPELLKNMGIACLRLVLDKKLTTTNYQLVVSTWLTAIHADQIMVQSLDATEWDDDYNFTLVDSIGAHSAYKNEVENINFDAVSSTNISIGATQRELITLFEKALNEISDEQLANTAQSFYADEKNALNQIIKTAKLKAVYAPPFFAKKYGLNEPVLQFLAKDFERKGDIDVLPVGLKYCADKKPLVFEQYSIIQQCLEQSVKAIQQNDYELLESQNTQENIDVLNKFTKFSTRFEQELIAAFDALIYENDDEDVIDLFEEAIELSPSKEQLKYKCAEFIGDLCRTILTENGNEIKGLRWTVRALNIYPESSINARLAVVLINNNLMNIINGETNQLQTIYQLCDEIHQLRSNALRTSLKDLANNRQRLLDQLGPVVQRQLNSSDLTTSGLNLKNCLTYMKKLSRV